MRKTSWRVYCWPTTKGIGFCSGGIGAGLAGGADRGVAPLPYPAPGRLSSSRVAVIPPRRSRGRAADAEAAEAPLPIPPNRGTAHSHGLRHGAAGLTLLLGESRRP